MSYIKKRSVVKITKKKYKPKLFSKKTKIYYRNIINKVVSYKKFKKFKDYRILAIKVRKRNAFLNLTTLNGLVIKRFSMGLQKQEGRGRNRPAIRNFLASLVSDKLAAAKIRLIELVMSEERRTLRHIVMGLGDNKFVKMRKRMSYNDYSPFNGCRLEKIRKKPGRKSMRFYHRFKLIEKSVSSALPSVFRKFNVLRKKPQLPKRLTVSWD